MLRATSVRRRSEYTYIRYAAVSMFVTDTFLRRMKPAAPPSSHSK